MSKSYKKNFNHNYDDDDEYRFYRRIKSDRKQKSRQACRKWKQRKLYREEMNG